MLQRSIHRAPGGRLREMRTHTHTRKSHGSPQLTPGGSRDGRCQEKNMATSAKPQAPSTLRPGDPVLRDRRRLGRAGQPNTSISNITVLCTEQYCGMPS